MNIIIQFCTYTSFRSGIILFLFCELPCIVNRW